jgi:lysophospholipase L1-like esterase
MRRTLFWFIPVLFALTGLAVFGTGFSWFVSGNRGVPVDTAPKSVGHVVMPQRIAAVVLGDSLARGTGDETGLGISGRLDQELKTRNIASQKTTNLAVNGARTADLLRQLQSDNIKRLIASSNLIVISIGGNDLWGDNNWQSMPPDPEVVMNDVLARVAEIVGIVRANNKTCRILVVGLYNPFRGQPVGKLLTPLIARWNSRMTERFADDPNFNIVQTSDLFSHHDRLSLDRFHPNGEAYGLIARRIADSL